MKKKKLNEKGEKEKYQRTKQKQLEGAKDLNTRQKQAMSEIICMKILHLERNYVLF